MAQGGRFFLFLACINTMRPRQDGHHHPDDIFKCIFLGFRWWLGAGQATSHYLNQYWLVYWRIYSSLGLSEFKIRGKLRYLNDFQIEACYFFIFSKCFEAFFTVETAHHNVFPFRECDTFTNTFEFTLKSDNTHQARQSLTKYGYYNNHNNNIHQHHT